MQEERMDAFLAEARDPHTAPERLIELSVLPPYTRLIAANPATPASTLETLSLHEEREVRQAVFLNMNTPLPCILRLAHEFSDAFLDHPLLPLLNLTQPDFFQLIDDATWLLLLRRDQIPLHWLEYLANRPWNLEMVNRWTKEATSFHHRYFPHTLQQRKAITWDTGPDFIELVVAREERTPGELLALLATNPSWIVRYEVAGNPSTPEHARKLLAADRRSVVRAQASTSENVFHRQYVKNPLYGPSPQLLAGDPAYFEEKAQAKRISYRIGAAADPRLPIHLFSLLAADHESSVRAAIASNASTPLKLLSRLLSDKEPNVRIALVTNPQLPPHFLDVLEQDEDETIRQRAQHRKKWLGQLSQQGLQEYTYHYYHEVVQYPLRLYEIYTRIEEMQSMKPANAILVFRDFLQKLDIPDTLRLGLIDLFLEPWELDWRKRGQFYWERKWRPQTEKPEDESNEEYLRFTYQQTDREPLFAELELSVRWQHIFAASPLCWERYQVAVKPGVERSILESLARDGNWYVRWAARFYLTQIGNENEGPLASAPQCVDTEQL